MLRHNNTQELAKSYCNSVIEVKATGVRFHSQFPDEPPTRATWRGTGFLVEGRMIITNAHVGDAELLEVHFPKGNTQTYPARLVKLGTDCDLAMLEVDSEEFWERGTELKIAEAEPLIGHV